MQYETKIDEFELYVIFLYSIECHMYTIFYNLCKRNINWLIIIYNNFIIFPGICVKIKGVANTCWTTDKQDMDERGQYRDGTQTVTAHEEYFDTKYYLVGSASGKILP